MRRKCIISIKKVTEDGKKRTENQCNAGAGQQKAGYNHYAYDNSTVNGVEVARLLGQDPGRVFKTLVTRGKSGGYFVFMVPVAEELDLKKAARACGEKAVEMLPQKELLPRTGYVHGGCSPIGMKKQFPTYIHQTAADYDTIFFSAGRVGAQVELPLSALQQALPVTPADIIKA